MCNRPLAIIMKVLTSHRLSPALLYDALPNPSISCALVRNNREVRVLTTNTNGPNAVLDVDTTKDIELVSGLWVRYRHRILDVSIYPTLLRLLAAAYSLGRSSASNRCILFPYDSNPTLGHNYH